MWGDLVRRFAGSRGILLALATSCGFFLAVWPARAASITEVQSKPTAAPSTSVACPTGRHVISGGGEVLAGGVPDPLTVSFKAHNGWRVSAYNSTSLVAYAYCSNHNYHLSTRKTDWVSTSDPLTAKCATGTHIVSGGGGIQNGVELGGLSQTMRERNGWVADANGIGPHSARAYCTAEPLKLEWSTGGPLPSLSPSPVLCETGVAFSGGGMAPSIGALTATRRTSEPPGWVVVGFDPDGIFVQVGCH